MHVLTPPIGVVSITGGLYADALSVILPEYLFTQKNAGKFNGFGPKARYSVRLPTGVRRDAFDANENLTCADGSEARRTGPPGLLPRCCQKHLRCGGGRPA